MKSPFTLINNIPIICNETIYIDEKYSLHLNKELYASTTPYILELSNMNINIILQLNEIYKIQLKTPFCTKFFQEYTQYLNEYYYIISARLISYDMKCWKFCIV